MEGWIKVHRSKLNWEWFSDYKTAHLFEYLLLKASYNEYKFRGVKLKSGQLPFGYNKASIETGLSVQMIRTSLRNLESTNEITKKSSRQGTIITIVNWKKWQGSTSDSTNNSTNELTSNQQASNKQSTTTNKVNNNNNENNILSYEKIDNELLDRIIQSWNTICASHKGLKHHKGTKPSTAKRFVELVSYNPELKKIDSWEECFESIKNNEFLNGSKNSSGFVCTLNWLIDKHTIIDVLNGQYGSDKHELDFSGLDAIIQEQA